MGGDYEKTIEQGGGAAVAEKEGKKGTKLNKRLRAHVSGGEVHIHDDKAGLKCAVKTADWYIIMRDLTRMNPCNYADSVNKTILELDPENDDGVWEVKMSLQPMEMGTTVQKLVDLTNKR